MGLNRYEMHIEKDPHHSLRSVITFGRQYSFTVSPNWFIDLEPGDLTLRVKSRDAGFSRRCRH
jgi:hypothetical protein